MRMLYITFHLHWWLECWTPRKWPPMIELHGGVCVFPGQPTRWGGNRVIDYPVTNIDKHFKMRLLGHALSDHPLIELTVDHRVSHIPQTSLQPTHKYQPPDTIAIIDTWKEMLETAWNDQHWNFHGTIKNQAQCNALWSNLMMCIEQSFRQACVSVQADCSQPRNFTYRNSKFRPKGSDAKVVTMAGQTKHPERFLPATRIRQLRNVLARLRELRLYELRGEYHPQKEHILDKCANVTNLPDTPINKQIQRVEELIRNFHHEQKIARINEWKSRLRDSPASVYSWLKGSNDIISSQIHFNDDEASQSMPEALDKLSCYWRSVWDTRQHSNTDSIQKCLEALGAPTPAAQWEPITAAELCTAASKQKGTAAGLDGFSGTEVSYLPLKFWTDVVQLFQEFERSGLIPEAWNNIKQVHLPKPNKGKRIRDGATDVATVRPICIMSVRFRLHASARFKSTSVQGWLDTWWPAEAFGGRRGKSIDDALLQVQYHAERSKYIDAFDYSLAFDMVDPKIALAIFKHLGMPLGWSRLLNGLWTNQHGLLQYDHECSPSYENVTRSLPQGDPWSMAAMTAVLLPPIRSIAQTLPGTQAITFVDDRAVICDTVASCMEATQHWNMWSATLGLKENPNREQFYHQTARGRAEFIQRDVNPEKIIESPNTWSMLKGYYSKETNRGWNLTCEKSSARSSTLCSSTTSP